MSRYRARRRRHRPAQPAVRRRRGAHARARRAAASRPWAPPDGPARHLHRDGPDRRERRRVREASPARRWTSSPRSSQQRAVAAQENGFFEREITPVTLARRHGRDARTTAPAPARPSRSSPSSSRCSAPTARSPPATPARSTTAPPPCIVMSDTKAERARHHAARPHRRRPACRRSNPEIMGLGPIEACRQALDARRHDDRRHRPRRDQRGVRRAGDPVGEAPRHPDGRSSTCTAARSRSATRSA